MPSRPKLMASSRVPRPPSRPPPQVRPHFARITHSQEDLEASEQAEEPFEGQEEPDEEGEGEGAVDQAWGSWDEGEEGQRDWEGGEEQADQEESWQDSAEDAAQAVEEDGEDWRSSAPWSKRRSGQGQRAAADESWEAGEKGEWTEEEWRQWYAEHPEEELADAARAEEPEEDWGDWGAEGRSEATEAPARGKGKGKGRRKEKAQDRYEQNERPEKWGDTWEEPREETGLQLIGEMAPEGVEWKYVLEDHSRRSYAGYLASPFSESRCQDLFETVKDCTTWKQPQGPHGVVPRKTAWMTKRGCSCTYRYGGLEVESQEFPPFMTELLEAAMPLCGINATEDWPDSCNLNLYEDGGMSVGWHSDDERLFQGKFRDIQIISLSFGQSRKFELRTNWPEVGEKCVRQIVLNSGDLMTMEGMTQRHFQHRVPKECYSEGPRINLTWRWVLKHNPRCPAGRGR